MTIQATAFPEASDVATFEADTTSLIFMQDLDYEFVGGGTAVNNL